MNVAIIEKLPRIGKKLLATGNGKCNLTNLFALEHGYVNKDFASFALESYPPEKTADFFESLGLLCYSDSAGRVYPESNMAASVVDALRLELERLFGHSIRGGAYPFGAFNDRVVEQLRVAGIRYCRTTVSTGLTAMPENWLTLHPTCHHNQENLIELIKKENTANQK